MSKRTIIIAVLGLLLIITGFLSYYFDVKNLVKDANDIINGEEPETKPKQERKPKQAAKEPLNETVSENADNPVVTGE